LYLRSSGQRAAIVGGREQPESVAQCSNEMSWGCGDGVKGSSVKVIMIDIRNGSPSLLASESIAGFLSHA